MKTKLFSFLLALAASVGTIIADGTKIGDLYYNLNAENRTAEVTYQEQWSENNYSGLTSANIPASVTYSGTTYSVTSIEGYAFRGCSSLTSITIPNSVTSIGASAFSSCSSLTSITIPNSVTSIGSRAFADCGSITTITIGCGVTSIGWSVFFLCKKLSSVVWNAKNCADFIPSSTPFHDDNQYESYNLGDNITSFVFGDEVEFIPAYLCSGMKKLTSVTIPNSVTSIGEGAFYECSSLTSVTIPNSVTSIGEGAFYECSSLTSVTIPNSVTSIGGYAFRGCSSLTSPVYNEHVFAFMPTSYSGDYSILEGIEQIAGGAFYGCSSLTSITIPNSVTSIGEGAFYECSNLTSVTIPNSVTSIGDHAFYECSSLTTITMKAETPPSLGAQVFVYVNISAIYVPCGLLNAYQSSWKEYASLIKYESLPYTISVIVNNSDAGHVNYPQGALTICDNHVTIEAVPNYGYHFTQWSDGVTDNPRTIVLTQDTTFTAEFAVDRSGTCGNDYALTWSYNPTDKCLTIQGSGAFDQHIQYGVEAPGNMEKLIVSEGVTTIGAGAFAYQATLLEVSLPTTLQTIGEQAFYNCTGLKHIYNFRERPCVAYSNSFDGIDKFSCTLHVLSASVDMYKAATAWRDFYYIQTIDATETTVATDKVSVEPTATTADVTWPAVENAATYELVIKDKNGNVVCTLIFNANGQLTQIAFGAPARDKAAQAAGFAFTVTGLEEGTAYDLAITAKDSNGSTLDEKTMAFTTAGGTGVEDTQTDGLRSTKVLRDGKIYILRGEKTYTVQGQEVK